MKQILKQVSVQVPMALSGGFVAAWVGVPQISLAVSAIGVLICSVASATIAACYD